MLQEKITVLQGRGTVKVIFCKCGTLAGKKSPYCKMEGPSEYHFTGWLPLNIIQNVVISEYHPGIMWLSANIMLQGGYL